MTIAYGTSRDAAAFLACYRDVHVPLVKQIRRLVRASWERCEDPSGSDRSPAHFVVAALAFADRAACQAAMATPPTAGTGKDLNKCADGGVAMVAYDRNLVGPARPARLFSSLPEATRERDWHVASANLKPAVGRVRRPSARRAWRRTIFWP